MIEHTRGAGGCVKKSKVTDNDSAKMTTARGVIQGYDGVAMVDAAHQVVVEATAFGEAQEQGLLVGRAAPPTALASTNSGWGIR